MKATHKKVNEMNKSYSILLSSSSLMLRLLMLLLAAWMRSNIYICCLVCVFKRVNITRTAAHVCVYFGVFSIYFYKRLCHLFWDLICHPSVRVGDRETERCMMTIEHAVNTRCVRTFAYTQCTRSTGHYGTVIFRWLLIYARRSLFLAILARIKSGCMYNVPIFWLPTFSIFIIWSVVKEFNARKVSPKLRSNFKLFYMRIFSKSWMAKFESICCSNYLSHYESIHIGFVCLKSLTQSSLSYVICTHTRTRRYEHFY